MFTTILGGAFAAIVAVAGAAVAAGAVPPAPAPSGRPEVIDEVPVTSMHLSAGFSNNSPLIARDPGEARFVVMANRVDAPDFDCALQVSGDRGRTWIEADPVPSLPAGVEKCYAPEVAFDAGGGLVYLFVGLAGRGNEPVGAYLVRSSDRGQTFTPPRRVLGAQSFSVRMAIDRSVGRRGRIHLVWVAARSETPLGGFGPPPNPILAAYSDDGGTTFSEPVQVSDAARARVVAPALALGPDRAVHVAYLDLGDDAIDYQGLEGAVWDGTWSLVLATSFDGGRRFGRGRVVDDGIHPAERVMLVFTMPPPSLAAGPGERVCAAWTDARHGDADAVVRCSPDRGRTWDARRRLNDDRPGTGARQYLPRLAVAPGGRLDAVFLDRRDDPGNTRNHVYLTSSTDGGRTFAPNRRISAEPSDSRIGAQYAHAAARGHYELGARLGLLSERAAAVVAWPDTRHTRTNPTGQDIFSVAVAMPEKRRGLGLATRAAGGGIAVAAIAGAATQARRRQRVRRGHEEPGS